MSKNRFIYLISALVSASAWGSSFQDLNQGLLKDYFNQNSISSGLSCQLSDEKILASYQHSSISSSYADCFIQDTSGYIIKMSSSCPAGTINGKLKAAAGTFCVTSTASSGGGSASGSNSRGTAKKGMTAMQTATVLTPAIIAAANVADVMGKKSGSVSTMAGGSSAISRVSNTAGTGKAVNTAIDAANANTQQANLAATPDKNDWTQTSQGTKVKEYDTDDGSSHVRAETTPGGYTVETQTGKDSSSSSVVFLDPNKKEITSDQYQAAVTKEYQDGGGKLVQKLPEAVQPAGAAVASATGSPAIDPEATAAIASSEASDTAFNTEMRAQISQGITEATTTLTETQSECSMSGLGCALIPKIQAALSALQKLQTTIGTYVPSKKTCSESAARAENFCSVVRSPTAQAVSTLMTVGGAALGQMSSASETCGTTEDLSSLAQKGMMLANLACSGVKLMCDSSCAASGKILTAMSADIKIAYGGAPASSGSMTRAVTKETTALETGVAPKIAQCQKYAANIAQMATQAVGLAVASAQAKDCKEKLTANDGDDSGGGGGGGIGGKPSAITTTQLCSDPKNATMSVCKCTANATAEGCPGAIAKLTTTSSPSFKSTGNGSQMAGPDAAFKQGSNLSAAAKSALGMNSDGTNNKGAANPSGLGFNGAGVGGADSNAAGAHGSANQKTDTAGSSKEKSKFNLGSFSSLGGAIGGFFGGSKKSNGGEKSAKDQIESAKRQIASEKVRSEISSASGRSNWDKVSTRYTESTSTFLGQ